MVNVRGLAPWVLVALLWPRDGRASGLQESGGRYGRAVATSASSTPFTVSGRVVDGISGLPVARALVSLGGRAVLTDGVGRFQFPGFREPEGVVRVRKPGFRESQDAVGGERQSLAVKLSGTLELKLYRDAVIAGALTGSDDVGLEQIPVQLRRLTFDGSGRRWAQVGFALTNTHGGFRFAVGAGRYRVTTAFAGANEERSDAVLPAAFPELDSTGQVADVAVASGEEIRADLHAKVAKAYPVHLHITGASGFQALRWTAALPPGDPFLLQATTLASADDYQLELPVGSYSVEAVSGQTGSTVQGAARLNVSPSGGTASVELVPITEFRVQSRFIDAGDGSTGAVNAFTPIVSPRGLNLLLRNSQNIGDGLHPDVTLNVSDFGTTLARVPAGRYRLASTAASGSWFVTSAMTGAVDLMQEDLVVGLGAVGAPIRMELSQALGHLHGSVADGGGVGRGWVYLVPEGPSLMQWAECVVQEDGSYTWSGPPGRYHVFASASRVREDLRDPVIRKKFSGGETTVELAAGGDAAQSLSLVTVEGR